ncbi:DUF4112 domain-containing protein [Sphingobium scionense]|uniref:DUF4112 domain-containing protein n=1 Tax=Sphingobium scionense TaxID=1404341 RepID=A0A7W6LSK9_9SPHN|nr:DUF4112 domain-containing protein [Sphingobium scionense]MBB4149372.1 hypothetical protein [Sphingobium scionense]
MPVSTKQFDDLVRDMPGFGRDPVSIRRRIEMMEALLEGLFVIPGTKRRVGLDSLVGLVPVVGDIATAAMGAWIVWEARNLGLSKWQITRMAANVGVDTLVGAIPFAGDIFDFLYKSNTKNLRIIRKHLDRHHPSTVTIDG